MRAAVLALALAACGGGDPAPTVERLPVAPTIQPQSPPPAHH